MAAIQQLPTPNADRDGPQDARSLTTAGNIVNGAAPVETVAVPYSAAHSSPYDPLLCSRAFTICPENSGLH